MGPVVSRRLVARRRRFAGECPLRVEDLASSIATNIEFPFFKHYLKGKAITKLPEAYVFETGTN